MKKYFLILGSLTAFVAYLSSPDPVFAATLTVCPSGTVGQNGCQFIGGEGIQQAVDAAKNGDTISLISGTYTNQKPRDFDSDSKAFVLVQDKNISLEGEVGVIIDGSASPADTCGITIMNNSQVTINEISVTGMRSREVDGSHYCGIGMLIAYGSPRAVVTNSQFTNNDASGIQLASNAQLIAENVMANKSKKRGGISLKGQAKADIRNSQSTENEGSGIKLADESSAVLTNSMLTANALYGADLYRNARLSLVNSTLDKNRLGGIGIQNTPTVLVKNSIFANHPESDGKSGFAIGSREYSGDGTNWVALRAPEKITVSKSIFWNNAAGNKNCDTHQICDFLGKIEADPLFVDAVNGDFNLQPNSPACTGGEGGTHMGAFPCGPDTGAISNLAVTCSASTVNPPTATFTWNRQTTNALEYFNLRINMKNSCKNTQGDTVPWFCQGSPDNSEDQFRVVKLDDPADCVKNGTTYSCSRTVPIKRNTQYDDWSVQAMVLGNAYVAPLPVLRVDTTGFSCGAVSTPPQCEGFNSYKTDLDASQGGEKPLAAVDTVNQEEVVVIKQANTDLEGTPEKQEICWTASGMDAEYYKKGREVFSCITTCSPTNEDLLNKIVNVGPSGALQSMIASEKGITAECTKQADKVLNGEIKGKVSAFVNTLPAEDVKDMAYQKGLLFVQSAWDSPQAGENTSPMFCSTNPFHSESGAVIDGSTIQTSTCGKRQTPPNLSDAEANCTRRITVDRTPLQIEGDLNNDAQVDQTDLTILTDAIDTTNCLLSLSSTGHNCLITIADYNELIGIIRQN